MSAASQQGVFKVVFGATILLSAFLLFLVQPLICTIILPWFGGSSAVWATGLMFFQVALCAGYFYAFTSNGYFTRKTQVIIHLVLLLISVLALPIRPLEDWEPKGEEAPLGQLLLVLIRFVGLPYLVLSTTAPLVQTWYARCYPKNTPYILYAVSNFGSLASLLMFPLFFERFFSLTDLAIYWSWAYVVFVLMCGYLTVWSWKLDPGVAYDSASRPLAAEPPMAEPANAPAQKKLGRLDYELWIALPALSTFMLLAGTNHVTQDMPPTPMVWVFLLALYLLAFIICFSLPKLYIRPLWVTLALVGLYLSASVHQLDSEKQVGNGVLFRAVPGSISATKMLNWSRMPLPDTLRFRQYEKINADAASGIDTEAKKYESPDLSPTFAERIEASTLVAPVNVGTYGKMIFHMFGLFGIFMVCTGELVRRQPDSKHLPTYYLLISVGGAIGGILVSLVAPKMLNTYGEWMTGLCLCILICGALLLDYSPTKKFAPRFLFLALPMLLLCAIAVWQNSSLPAAVANKVASAEDQATKTRLAARLEQYNNSTLPNNAKRIELFRQINDQRRDQIVNLFPSAMAIFTLLGIFALIGLGAYACFSTSVVSESIRYCVLSLTVVLIVCIICYDVITFLEVYTPVTVASQEQKEMLEIAKKTEPQEDDIPSNKKIADTAKDIVDNEPTTPEDDDEETSDDKKVIWKGRNFYGALSITRQTDTDHEDPTKKYVRHSLMHGRILHGLQFTTGPYREAQTSYYSAHSGMGLAFGNFRRNDQVRIGAIGLGTGSIASFGKQVGHDITFYEINPMVEDIAEGRIKDRDGNPFFTYLADARAHGSKVNILLGDARLTLKRQLKDDGPQNYDLLVVDAFSGDAIPRHLLTREACELYLQHLKSHEGIVKVEGKDVKRRVIDGILAIHISNRYMDLKPVCWDLADRYHLEGLRVDVRERTITDQGSEWILLTNDEEFRQAMITQDLAEDFPPKNPGPDVLRPVTWTDDKSPLYDILK